MKNAMFHVTLSRRLAIALVVVIFCYLALSPRAAFAQVADAEMASHIATLLGEKFSPESLVVTVKESRAYAEMRGSVLSGIRIDTMKLDALLARKEDALSNDVGSLASLIGYSRGEIILLEKDVNAYFDTNDTRGFSSLDFDFTPQGFKAKGVFSADFIFRLRIQLAANGVLGLGQDGVYLEDVSIYVENVRQPSALTNQILSRVNPLLAFSEIPFKVEFKNVTMDDEAAYMTGHPKKLEGGSTSEWPRKGL
jgi:hypothetical protein